MKLLRILLIPLLYVGPTAADYSDNAFNSIKILNNKWYDTKRGVWGNTWWQSGNMLETIAKFGLKDPGFKQAAIDIVKNTYEKSPNQFGAHNWKNDYYDDEGWWAMGWIASYDLTKDVKYLNTAKDIFYDMTGGWSTPCKGGIWWDKKKTSVAAISNELFISVAAHLANRVPANEKEEYVRWASMGWDWFWLSGIINKDNLVNDGLDTKTCKNNGQTTFTYNQGVILGALSEIARAKGDGGYIQHAYALARGSMSKLSQNGILTEPVDRLDEQGAMFKGVLVRGLATLHANEPQKDFADWLKKNADSIWNKDRDQEGLLGPKWQGGGPDGPSVTSHAAGIDALVAAAAA